MVLLRESGEIRHHAFRDLPELLAPGDLLVVNRSRVFPARLRGHRGTGGAVEVLLLRHLGGTDWDALLRPGRRLRAGDLVLVDDLSVKVVSGPVAPDGRRRVRLQAAPHETTEAAIDRLGRTPLPPYIRRQDRPSDRERYQTVYAREPGSVAAPTAGLHFTPRLRDRLAAKGVEWTEILLHVGPGTFQPVQVEDAELHRVVPEAYEVPVEAAAAVERARLRGSRVVAVGTTSVRALETAGGADGNPAAICGETALVIVPGYRFRATTALLTNFHLPRSSLLLLVAAFAGRDVVLRAYREAVKEAYRFYSYGDAMLIL